MNDKSRPSINIIHTTAVIRIEFFLFSSRRLTRDSLRELGPKCSRFGELNRKSWRFLPVQGGAEGTGTFLTPQIRRRAFKMGTFQYSNHWTKSFRIPSCKPACVLCIAPMFPCCDETGCQKTREAYPIEPSSRVLQSCLLSTPDIQGTEEVPREEVPP